MLWLSLLFFFFNYTATTEIYTLSLHDALPIQRRALPSQDLQRRLRHRRGSAGRFAVRSEEHTSELQSLAYIVCRLLLEKQKKKKKKTNKEKKQKQKKEKKKKKTKK